jgi:hypothetical protein
MRHIPIHIPPALPGQRLKALRDALGVSARVQIKRGQNSFSHLKRYVLFPRMACSEVSIHPPVDTSRCAHNWHHPYRLTLRLNSTGVTLTLFQHNDVWSSVPL